MTCAKLLLCLCCLPLAAVAADDERASIADQRRELAATFDAQERACASRFRVNACIEDVRARRRGSLAPLREWELRLDEAERRERAQQRRAAIAAKQASAAARPAASAVPELRVRPPRPAASAASRSLTPRDGSARTHSSGAADAEQRQRELQQRRQEAQDVQARIKQRQAQRDAAGRKAEPLPVPGAPSAPRR